MRITNKMLIGNMINYIGTNLGRMDKLQNELATGKKIRVPSDDPIVAARALKLRTDVSEIEQYGRNVQDANSWMDITESTLDDMTDILQRARELAVQGANGTTTPDDTAKIEQEVIQLRRQIIHLGNSTYSGRYIFSGYKTDMPLFDEVTGKFNIDVSLDESIRYEIGIGDSININITGGDLFNQGTEALRDTSGSATGDSDIMNLDIQAGVNDVLSLTVDGEAVSVTIPAMVYPSDEALAAALQIETNNTTVTATDIMVTVEGGRLSFKSGSRLYESIISIDGASSAAADLGLATTTQTDGADIPVSKLIQDFDDMISALHSGDHEAVGSVLAKMDDNLSNILRIRADVGARMNRLELTENRLMSNNINFTKLMSENEDIDVAETMMNLKNEENVYKSSLSGGARIIMPTLLDFLR